MTDDDGTKDIAGGNPAIGEPVIGGPLDDAPLPTERLALGGDDERLPWLEADDDELPAGVDSGRIMGAGILGLAVLAALVGAIWWFSHRGADSDLVADGSTIPAPATPYKQAPAAPGGKTFQGTGDTSFAVSAGQTRTGKIADAPTGPAPASGSPMPSVTSSAKPAMAHASASAAAPAATGVGVQVGAFSSAASAEAAWTRMAATHDALAGVRHRVIEGRADIGTVYRLQAVAGDDAAAGALCAKLQQGGVPCQVKRGG